MSLNVILIFVNLVVTCIVFPDICLFLPLVLPGIYLLILFAPSYVTCFVSIGLFLVMQDVLSEVVVVFPGTILFLRNFSAVFEAFLMSP